MELQWMLRSEGQFLIDLILSVYVCVCWWMEELCI